MADREKVQDASPLPERSLDEAQRATITRPGASGDRAGVGQLRHRARAGLEGARRGQPHRARVRAAGKGSADRGYWLWGWVSGPCAGGRPAQRPGRSDRVGGAQVRIHSARDRCGRHRQRPCHQRPLRGARRRRGTRGLRGGHRPRGRPPLHSRRAGLAAARRRRASWSPGRASATPRRRRSSSSAAEALAMQPEEIRHVGPFAGSEHRHLHLIRKSGPTPPICRAARAWPRSARYGDPLAN